MDGDDSFGALLDFAFRVPENHVYFREAFQYQRILSAAKSVLVKTVAITEQKEKAKI